MTGIYAIINKLNNKKYVGKSEHLEKRLNNHKNKLLANKHINKHLQNSFNKYGLDNFDFIVIEECSIENINEKEIYWINKFNSCEKNYGFNKTLGGTGGKLTPEAIEKIASTLRGRKHTDEYKKKLSKICKDKKIGIGEKNGMFGKTPWNKGLTKDTSEKIKSIGIKVSNYNKSNKPTRKKLTIEQKEKLSNSLKGIKKSESHKKKLSEINIWKKRLIKYKHISKEQILDLVIQNKKAKEILDLLKINRLRALYHLYEYYFGAKNHKDLLNKIKDYK